jgi:Resolvase, N terminal domain
VASAAIYTRISKDTAGLGLGVDRQERECRELAARQRLDVAEVFADNDLFAYGGRRRPGYEALLATIREGCVRTVIAWHPDRLTRSVRELEDLVDLLEGSAARRTHRHGRHLRPAHPIRPDDRPHHRRHGPLRERTQGRAAARQVGRARTSRAAARWSDPLRASCRATRVTTPARRRRCGIWLAASSRAPVCSPSPGPRRPRRRHERRPSVASLNGPYRSPESRSRRPTGPPP